MYTWNHVKYFKETENWGDPSRMKDAFISKLDNFRGAIGAPFIITSGTQGRHAINSLHYRGEAADFIILSDIAPLDVILLALKHGFTGVGYYPGWVYKDKIIGGYHLDFSDARAETATWLGISSGGHKIYEPLSHKNLVQYGII